MLDNVLPIVIPDPIGNPVFEKAGRWIPAFRRRSKSYGGQVAGMTDPIHKKRSSVSERFQITQSLNH